MPITLSICYRAITQLGDSTTNYHLKPGDRIFVARQSFCEEIYGFLSPGKTCERCRKQQCPCPDPSLADRDANPFMHSGVHVIASPRPPEFTRSGADVNERPTVRYQPESARLPAEPVAVPQQNATFPTDSERPFVQPQNPGLSLDGELDFDGFVNRPRSE